MLTEEGDDKSNSGFKINYNIVMLLLKNFTFKFLQEMMPEHHLEEAVPGQNKLDVGTNGSEWCRGYIITDSQCPTHIPTAKSVCLNVIFHITGMRNIILWLNTQMTTKVLDSITDTQ